MKKTYHYWFLIIPFLLSVFSYANTLANSFVSDDKLITQFTVAKSWNEVITQPMGILFDILHKILFFLFGANPIPAHMVSILLHAINATLVTLLVFIVGNPLSAVVAGSLFAVHPLLSETVAWISASKYLLYTSFFLATLILYAKRERKRLYYPLSICTFFLTFLASEKALPLVALIGIFEFAFGNLKKNWKHLLPFIAIFTLFTSILFVSGSLTGRVQDIVVDYSGESGYDNVLIKIPIALTTYIELFVIPIRLTFYHSEFILSPVEYVVRLVLTILLFGFMAYMAYTKRRIFFWLSLFLIPLTLTLTPLKIAWAVAERYVYLSSVGLIALASFGLFWLYKKTGSTIFILVVSLVILILSMRTIIRNTDWTNEDTLWLATAQYSPLSPQNNNNLGDVYARRGNYPQAISHFSRAIELMPNYADAYHNRGNVYAAMGDLEQARMNYQKALELRPSLWQSQDNLDTINDLLNKK